MRTLIYPTCITQTANDDYWLRSIAHDRVVFLGDYTTTRLKMPERTDCWL